MRRARADRSSGIRIGAAVAACALALVWLGSLPPLWLSGSAHSRSIERMSEPPDWRDMLVLRLKLGGIGVQQVPVDVGWSQQQPGGYAIGYRTSLNVLTDGRPHSYLIAVGLHPEWRGDIRNLRLIAPLHQDAMALVDRQLIRRPFWALDLWLGRLLAPYLVADIVWPHLALFTAALLTLGVALAWPTARWRRRVDLALILLTGSTGIATVAALLGVVGASYRFYHGLDERSAMAYVTAPTGVAQFDRHLIDGIASLPAGPILVNGLTDDSYLAMRARYLLYPRQVDSADLRSPAGLQQRQRGSYVGLIQPQQLDPPQGAGWQRVSVAAAEPAIWRRANLPPEALPLPPVSAALPRLLAGLALMAAAGWAVAGWLGWRGWERLWCAWPVGVNILAWWMFALNIAGLAWTWWSIGLPLVLGVLLAQLADLWGYSWKESVRAPVVRADPQVSLLNSLQTSPRFAAAPRQPLVWHRIAERGWQLYGVLVIGVLFICLIAQAVLVPFSDADTWRIWSFKARGFYIDGSMASALQIYRQVNLYHAGYPPAQPLAQAWGYIAMGGISERLVKLVFPCWYLACVGTTYCACRQWCSRTIAMAWTLLLATAPIMLDHATLGNADLALAGALLVGACALVRWLKAGRRHWLSAAVLGMGGAAWIKLDGLYLGAGMIGLALILRVLICRRESGGRRDAMLAGSSALVALLAIGMVWQRYATALGLNSDIPGSSVLHSQGMAIVGQSLAVVSSELLLSHSNSSLGLLGSGYGLFWLVCAVAILTRWRVVVRDAVSAFLLTSVLSGIACYAFMYMLVPYYSIERYLLHLAPLMVLAAARSTRQAELAEPMAETAPLLQRSR